MLKSFRLVQPQSVEAASRELAERGDEASIYAGGAELLLLMRQGIIEPKYLIDIKHIPELAGVREDDGGVAIGANITHRHLERDTQIRSLLPLLAEAESHVGNIRVRNQGTLGGNLCFADPHADPATALLVHDTNVTIGSAQGRRSLPLDDFLLGTYETALQPEEILVSVQVVPLPAGWTWAYERVERFYRPTLNVAVAAQASGRVIGDVRMAVGCVGPRAMRLTALEDTLRGRDLDDAIAAIRDAAPYVEEQLEPVDDLLGPADYKIDITGVLLGRALRQAVEGERHA